MSEEWYEQQHGMDDDMARGAAERYSDPYARRNHPGDTFPGDNAASASLEEPNQVHATARGWTEGPGWRMKAPDEIRRRQVIRGLEAAERVDRDRQQRRSTGAKYSIPSSGQAVLGGDRSGAAVGMVPLSEEQLRIARIRDDRARKLKLKQARDESKRRALAERDAPIQRRLERARRNQEKLESKQRREHAQVRETTRASWAQRQLSTTPDHPSPTKINARLPPARGGIYAAGGGAVVDWPEDLEALWEAQQIEVAVRNGLADFEGVRGAAMVSPPPSTTPTPPLPRPGVTPAHSEMATPTRPVGGGMPHPAAGARGSPDGNPPPHLRGPNTAVYWDPILDGTIPAAALSAGNNNNDGGGVGDASKGESGGNWDGVLAEAITVAEWDLPDEISLEAEREGFRRCLGRLFGDMVERNERLTRVRNDNRTFQTNIGRWACGRRLMRLAGFSLEREIATPSPNPQAAGASAAAGAEGEKNGYVWIARAPRPEGQLRMLRGLVGALEDQGAGVAATVHGGGAGGVRAPSPPREGPADFRAGTNYEFASGICSRSPSSRSSGGLTAAAKGQDEFSRIRREQDEAFEETLRRDKAKASAAVAAVPAAVPAAAATDNGGLPVELGSTDGAAESGRSLGGPAGAEPGTGDDSSVVPSHVEETAEERRAKIAQSFARLGIGS